MIKQTKLNLFELPDWYFDEDVDSALKRLKSPIGYRLHPSEDDADLILNHWKADVNNDSVRFNFYIVAFEFIIIKALGKRNGTLTRPLPDAYIGKVIDAIKLQPDERFDVILTDLLDVCNKPELKDYHNQAAGLLKHIYGANARAKGTGQKVSDEQIEHALIRWNGNVANAARFLKVHKQTLHVRIKESAELKALIRELRANKHGAE